MKMSEDELVKKTKTIEQTRKITKMKTKKPLNAHVNNFLTGGQLITIYNQYGDRKELHLSVSDNLKFLTAQKPKSTKKPKDKNVLEVYKIKTITKGFGTTNFEKFKTYFVRTAPNPECCFSVIEGASIKGVKSLNIECDNVQQADMWVDYLGQLVNKAKKGLGKQKTTVIR